MALSAVLGEALVPIRAQFDALERDLKQARQKVEANLGKAMRDVGKSLRSTGQTLSTYVTLPIMGAAGAAVKLAGDFEYAMNVLQSVSGATSTELAKMRQLAVELGNDVALPGTSAIDAAEAMTELVKAGLSVEQTMKAARGVLVLSAAAEVSNAEAAEITANALNAFRLSGDKATYVADLLANAANAASGEIIDMAYGLRQSAAVSAMAGQDIADVVTALSLMANAGIQGSDAGTSLKQMFLSLINPTDKAKKLMKELGIELFTSSGQLKPLPQLIEEFRGALSKLTPAQRNQALATIFGSDAIRAANIVLMASADEWNNMRAAVTRAGGAQDVAAAKMKGFRGALEAFRSTLETLGITLGEKILPHVTAFLQTLTKLVNWFGELPGPVQTTILALAGVAAIVGPLLVGLGAVVSAIGTLMTVGPAVAAALGSVVTVAGPVVLAVMGAAAALYVLFRAGKAVWPKLAAAAKKAGPAIAGAMDQANKALGRLGQELRSMLGRAVDWVVRTAGQIGSGIERAGQAVADALGRAGDAVTAFVRRGVAQLQTFLVRVASWANGIVSNATSAMARFGSVVASAMSRALSTVSGFVSLATSRLQAIVRYVASWGSSIAARAASAMSAFASAVRSGINRAVSFFGDLGNRALSAVRGALGRMVSIGRNLAEGLWSGISKMGGWLKNKILGWAKSVIPDPLERFFGIRSPSRLMARYGKFIAQGLVKGLTGSASEIKRAAEQTARLMRDAFGGAREKRLLAMLSANTARLQKLAAQRDAIAKQIAEAHKMAADVASKALEYASIGNLNLGVEGPVTANSVIQSLSDRLRQMRAFASNLRILGGMGLSKDLLRQLIDMGVDQGGAYAAALVAGGRSAVAQINKLQRQINAAAQVLGQVAADIMYDAGMLAAKGFLAGLQEQKKDIEAAMRRIAQSVQATLRSELRMRSPSRVMMDLGRNIVRGLVAGMERQAVLVAAAASYLSSQAASAVAASALPPVSVVHADMQEAAIMGAGKPITILVPVYLNGRQIARASATYVDEELAARQRRVSRARGEVY
ncbi:phage tail tape measure protein, TP901 family [Thermaerobacter marianensis DSM 12885]|uniref:Phage tail tape measure protein, TP901 family n=1 Tax=Thermaerobacter marianensis (strain ATCC 700841 / DSM 12885 / JCM 10246 / 7p75a) TaxID=644966 RepID=E6SKI6_THEM7|nr:phage tail tape measure protein [Thermaerobacter marianensis]ADU50173.1 phage tail tape measure protein, TP901 family [Thermaerobacter marianensis DSM 12885]